jgi:hypothetical protein
VRVRGCAGAAVVEIDWGSVRGAESDGGEHREEQREVAGDCGRDRGTREVNLSNEDLRNETNNSLNFPIDSSICDII